MGVDLGSAYGEIVIGTDQAQANVQSLSQQLRSVGSTMSLAISAPLIAVGAAAINSAAGFEQSLNVMQQVSGATAETMDALRDQALQLGADTVFSAGEAAEGMLELAKAGMNTEQVGQAIAGVMQLAAAGGVGLAEAAGLTTAALNSFGLQASESSRIADILSAAANASSADIVDLGSGLQQAGFAFDMAGQGVDDLAASLAILTNVGLTGSDAGTALKNAMMRLMNPTKEAAKAMRSVGFSAYDANGNMRTMEEIIGGLNTATRGMTNQQRDAFLATVFLSDGMKAIIPLMDEGTAGFVEMKNAVNQQGAAAQVSDARMGGFRGAIEAVKGSIESLLIGAVFPFLDSLSGIARQVAEAINWVGALPAPLTNAALAFAAVLAAAGPLMLAISGISAVIGALTSPIGLVVVALAGLAAAWAADWGGIQEKTAAAWAAVRPVLAAFWQGLQNLGRYLSFAFTEGDQLNDWLTYMPQAIRPAVLWMGTMAARLGEALPAAMATLRTKFGEGWAAIQGAVSSAWTAVQPQLTKAWGWLQTTLPGALAKLQAGFDTAWSAVSGAVDTAWTAIQITWTTIQTWLQTNLPTAVSGLQSAWETAWPAIRGAVDTAWRTMQTTWTTIQTWLQTNLPTAVSGLQSAWETAWPAIRGAVDTAWTVMQTTWTTIQTWLQTNLPDALTGLQTAFTTVWEGLPGVVTTAQTSLDTAFTAIEAAWQTLVDIFGPAIERIKTSFGGLSTQVEPIKTSLSGLLTAFQKLWTAVQPILEPLGKLLAAAFGVATLALLNGFSAAIDALGPVVTTVVDQISATINTIADIISEVTALVQAVIAGDWTAAWDAAQEIVATLVDYLGTTWGNFQELMGAIFGAIYDTVVNTLTDLGIDAQGAVDSIQTWWAEKWGAIQGVIDGVRGAIDALRTKITDFKNWLGSLHIPNPFSGITMPSWVPGFASGTSYAPGGMVEVGERGREFIVPPAGSKVLTNGQSNRLAGQGGGEQVFNITVNGVQLRNERDGERLGYRVAGMIAAAAG